VDEKAARRSDHGSGRGQGREDAGRHEPLRSAQHRAAHQLNAALKAWNLFHKDQQYIIKDGEVVIVDSFTGRSDVRAPLFRRHPPSHRGQGRHHGSRRGPDAGDHHVPESLPALRGSSRHDRYGEDRDAQIRDIYGLDVVVVRQHADGRRDSSDIVFKSEKAKFEAVVAESSRVQQGPAGSRRHAFDREERTARCDAAPPGRRVQRAQREVPRARGRNHQKTRPARAGDDRHQHGRPRHRHQLGEGVAKNGGLHIIGTERHDRGASTISCAAAPAVKAIRGRRALRFVGRRSDAPCSAATV